MKSVTTTLCLLIAAILINAGCSSQVISSSDQTIIIRPGFPDKGIVNALALAEKECLKRSRSAKIPSVTTFNTDIYTFKCIKE